MEGFPPPPPGIDLSATQQPRIYGAVITTLILAFIAVFLRFLARRLSNNALWWDDWLVVPALILSTIGSLLCVAYMVPGGTGKHVWANPPDSIYIWFKALFFWSLCYTLIMTCLKFSMLALYWRIFKESSIRIPIYFLSAMVGCWCIAVFFVTIFQCIPVSTYWNQFSPDYKGVPKCGVDTKKYFNGNCVAHVLLDAMILLLPLPYIWRLHLPTMQKALLSGIFLLGSFVLAVSIVRLVYLVTADVSNPDITWDTVDPTLWTGVETNIACVCVCLPSLRPLLTFIRTGSAKRSNYYDNSDKGASRRSGGLKSPFSPSFGPKHNSRLDSTMKSAGDGPWSALPDTENGDQKYSIHGTKASASFDSDVPLAYLPQNNTIGVKQETSVNYENAINDVRK